MVSRLQAQFVVILDRDHYTSDAAKRWLDELGAFGVIAKMRERAMPCMHVDHYQCGDNDCKFKCQVCGFVCRPHNHQQETTDAGDRQ